MNRDNRYSREDVEGLIFEMGRLFLLRLSERAGRYWRAAHEFDKIAPGAGPVIFSRGNPYAPLYGAAVRELDAAMRERIAGGYVGLELRGGRAVIPAWALCEMGLDGAEDIAVMGYDDNGAGTDNEEEW